MSKKEKLVERLLSIPADFTFDEVSTLLGHFGYSIDNSGKTSGSRIRFKNSDADYIRLHKPHPRNILKQYQVTDLIVALQERGLI